MFIDERGQIKLIDNDAAFQISWLNELCGFDSFLIPTSQKHTLLRLSNHVRGIVIRSDRSVDFDSSVSSLADAVDAVWGLGGQLSVHDSSHLVHKDEILKILHRAGSPRHAFIKRVLPNMHS